MAYFGVQYTNESDSNGRMKALASSVPTPGMRRECRIADSDRILGGLESCA